MTAASSPHHENHTRSLVAVWALLVVLTLASWWFRDHGLSPVIAIAVILALTFVKVFMVGQSFMEIRFGPRAMKRIFAGWCVGMCAILIVMATVL